ncbi:hypothetical protein D3C84_1130520 [compost metagenome]
MKNTTVNVRKPRTGTDWRISKAGRITIAALRLLAANVATTKEKTNEANKAMNMRNVVRKVYSGRCTSSRDNGEASSTPRGWFI